MNSHRLISIVHILPFLLLSLAGSSQVVFASSIEGYVWPPSAVQGDTVGIYVSTDTTSYDIRILREGASTVQYLEILGLPGVSQVTQVCAWVEGSGWILSHALPIPTDWPSGVYFAELTAPGADTSYAVFTVVEDAPGSTGSILFQNSITTWHAYNYWGGKSLYDGTSTNNQRAWEVSFQRPYVRANGRGSFIEWELPFIRWVENEGYVIEYCTNIETHADPDLESNYSVFLSVGHDEYWSKEMRDNIEGRIASGGEVGFFGGNTCWWQIRFSDELDRVICYKDKFLDPLYGVDDDRVTVNWVSDPVLRPENIMTGVSWSNGGFVNSGPWYPDSLGYGGYTAHRTYHWVFDGTGLSDSSGFGQPSTIVGYETDGALFTMQNGVPVGTGQDSTPLSYLILGTSVASKGFATMGIYEQGGTVFNAATTDWSHGLATDSTVAQITRNVIEGLLAGTTTVGVEDPHLRIRPRVRLQVMKNPTAGGTRIQWEGNIGSNPILSVFDLHGRLLAQPTFWNDSAGGFSDWDGADQKGRRAPPGVYFIRLRGSNGSAVGKVVILD